MYYRYCSGGWGCPQVMQDSINCRLTIDSSLQCRDGARRVFSDKADIARAKTYFTESEMEQCKES